MEELPQNLPLIDEQSKSKSRISTFPTTLCSNHFTKEQVKMGTENKDSSYFLSDLLIKEDQVLLPNQTVNLVDSLVMALESKDQNQEGAQAAKGFHLTMQSILELRFKL